LSLALCEPEIAHLTLSVSENERTFIAPRGPARGLGKFFFVGRLNEPFPPGIRITVIAVWNLPLSAAIVARGQKSEDAWRLSRIREPVDYAL